MAKNINLKEYLTDNIIRQISFAMNSKEDGLEKNSFMLANGTVITIEKHDKLICGNAFVGDIRNPRGFKISGKCLVEMMYDAGDGNIGIANIYTKSNKDLESAWNHYKDNHNIDKDTIGEIVGVKFTREQEKHILKLENAVNDLLNLLTDTNVELNEDDHLDMKFSERYALINFVLTNISRNLVRFGIVDKVHLPFIRKDDDGSFIEIYDYADSKVFLED